jgi:hypothetical protein
MPKKRFGAEQIVTLLRQIEVSKAQGKPTPVAEGVELETNLLRASQRGPASSSVLDEVFGTHRSKIFPTHVLRTTGTTPPVQHTPGVPAQPDGPTLHQRCAAPLRRRTARSGRITLAGLENVICSYPEYSPGHGTHPRPDSAVVIAGPDQAHIAIAGPDDLANVVMMAGTPDHHRADLRRCSSTPIPPIAGEIVFATGV